MKTNNRMDVPPPQEYVSVVVSGDDVKSSKPAPDCYILATEYLGIQPSECIASEDTKHGVFSATSADIKCIGVSTSDSESVRKGFDKTTYVCSNLNMATQ
jgi:HAD superfamily hydrolase (TIGR01509 family)